MGRASPPLRETPHVHEKGLPRSGGEGAKLKGNEEKSIVFLETQSDVLLFTT